MDLETQLYDYMTKKCKTFDPSSRSIHTSDLHRVINHFNLNHCPVQSDSQGRVAFSELRYLLFHESRLSPPGGMLPQHQTSSHYPSSHQPPPPSSSRHPPTSFFTSGIPIPYETDESFTPDPEYTPDDINYNPQENPDYDTPWSNPGSPPDPGGVPVSSHGHPQWTNDEYHITTATGNTRRGGNYCTNCNYWQARAQDLEEKFVSVNREKDSLQVFAEKLQKNLQQNGDYYSAYQMVMKENSKYKQELKKLRDQGSMSDSGSAGYMERQLEEVKRKKEDLESSLKQYKKHYSGMRQENDRLKYEIHTQQTKVWYLQDEKQRLETTHLSKMDGRIPGGGGYYHAAAQHQQGDHDGGEPMKDYKSLRNKQSMADGSDGSSQSQVFVVLGEDVSSSVLPESLTQEQHYQMVCGLQNCHSIEELLRCLVSYGIGALMEDKTHGIKVENDHLRSRVKTLEAKYDTLSNSFEAAKLETEEMFRKMSSVEANNIRLRHAVKLCQQACEVHEMLYEMKEAEARPPSTSSAFSPMDFDSPTRTASHDINAAKNVLSRVRSFLKLMESNQELQSFLPTVHGKTSTAGWNLSMSQYTGTTSGLSCASSIGPEAELNSTEVEQLKVYYQALVRYSKHLLDTLVVIDGLQGASTMKDPTMLKDSKEPDPHSRILEMEETADTEELCKIREEKAELRSQIYMMEQSKRSMELQLSRKSLHCLMLERQCNEQRTLHQMERKKRQKLKDKIKQLKSENPHVPDWTEQNEQIKVAWDAEGIVAQRYDDLFVYLQNHVEKSHSVTEKLVDFVKELLRANRALVEAFERAKKRQLSEKQQLKSELKKSLMHKPSSHAAL